MAVNIDDILASVSSPSLIKDSYINKGQFLHLSNGDFEIYTGGFTVVFPVIVNGEKWAFRCWHANLGNVRRRFEAIAHAIQKSKASYLCDFAYTDEGIIVDGKIYPTTRMRWVDGLPIKEYICRYKSDKKILEALAKKFLSLVQDMHRNYLAHGDLQHGNIIVDTSGELFLVDYDSFYCEDLKGEPDIITGLKDYQHPLRRTNKITSEKIDYFSELIIYLSIIGIAEDPTLVPRFQIADADRLLFESTDFANLKSSRIYNALKGKTPVIDILLSVLEQYLQCSSINQLEPFDILFTQSLENLRPKVKSFEVSKELVTDADIVTLSWSTKNATYVTLNGVRVAANGSKELPAKEKYVLRTKNDVDIIEKSIKIKVKYPLVISSFVVKDENVVAEKACSIQWEGRNVASILLDNEEYPVKSPISFVPAESGKHEVKFIGKDGSEYYRTVSVEVKQSTNGCLKAFLVFILVIIVGLLFVLLVGNTTSTTPKPTPKSSGKTHPTTITTKQSQIDANVQALANAVNQADVDHIESLEVAVKKLNELKKLRPYNGEDETKIRNRAQKIKDEIESSPVSDLPENQRKIEQINNILNRL